MCDMMRCVMLIGRFAAGLRRVFCARRLPWVKGAAQKKKLTLLPLKPKPASPVQSARKFSAVFGTSSP